MIALDLIGIGTGNPDHLTRAAIASLAESLRDTVSSKPALILYGPLMEP
jgi:precorrin-2 methylase